MKRLLPALLLLLAVKTPFAQNLVPNPSFEDTVQCPDFVSQIDRAKYWVTIINTPDYYHQCNNTSQNNPGMVGVPNSARGYQPARTGVAFAGEVNYYTAQTNYRETFYAQLLSPLSAGVKYNVGMYVVLNEDNAQWAVDGGLGIYLSATTINPSTPFAYTPQIMNPLTNVLNDSLNWTKISGTYTAAGGEQYITIGSFIPDNQLTIINRGGTYPFTSYAIDDVWVVPDSLTTGESETGSSFEVSLFPNPAGEQVKVKVNMKSGMTLFNCVGEKISESPLAAGMNEVRLKALAPGIYFIRISNEKGITTRKLVKE